MKQNLLCLGLVLLVGRLLMPELVQAETIRLSADTVEVMNGELRLPVSLKCPQFSFNVGVVGGTQLPAQLTGNLAAGEELLAQYAPIPLSGTAATLEVKLYMAWNGQEKVLRKWVEYRLNPVPTGCVIHEILFDRLDPVAGQPIAFLPAPPQSLPGFLRGFYAGIEFPIACTRLEENALIVAQRPGRLISSDSGWLRSRNAMYGTAPIGQERETFAAVIAQHRPQPHGLHFNYNSWYSLPWPYSEKMIQDLMQKFQDNMTKPYGVSFDTFAIDMGWSDLKTLWEINKPMFPDGFANIKAQAERMNSKLGLWISPTSCYPPALDNEWAKTQGYETYLTGADGKFRACCLGGRKYAEAFKNRLVSLASESGVRHFKLDGYWFTCTESGHGHQPGADAPEAIAEGGIRAFEAVRAAVPNVWLEPTCFGPNPSPWWLYYVNSVTGTFGDDNPPPRCPCPIDRESMTSGRDFFNLQGASLLPLPIVTQEVLGINHQTEHPLLNDAVDVVLRGHAFVPLYVNPRNMNPRRWEMLADLIKWARANEATLAQTTPLLPPSWRKGAVPHFTDTPAMPREAYGYLHWVDNRGLVLLRNPWIKQQTVHLELGSQVGVPAGTSGLSAVSLYPEVRVYGQNLNAQSALDVTLAPYETVLISLNAAQDTGGLPPADQCVGRDIQCEQIKTQINRVFFTHESSPEMGTDWTRQLGDVDEAYKVALSGTVWGDQNTTELMLIFEGKGHSPVLFREKIEVNGKPVIPAENASEGIWKATGLATPEYWTILRVPLAQGKNEINLELLADLDTTTVSCWMWSYKNTSPAPVRYPNALPNPEQLYLASKPVFEETALTKTMPIEQRPHPVERIDGVYLDTLKPVQATQEYGVLQYNRSVEQKPLHIKGRSFARGLGSHANGRIVYDIANQGFKRFQAWVGTDSEVPVSSIAITILVDGAKRWESGLMTGLDAAKLAEVDITNGKTLELIVDNAGDGNGGDHADFGEAKLLRNVLK